MLRLSSSVARDIVRRCGGISPVFARALSSRGGASGVALTNELKNDEMVEFANNVDVEHIRNFSIIAHVDHGKSTLADRLLLLTGKLKGHDHQKQTLDTLRVEQERGITVKSQTVSLLYEHPQPKDQSTRYLVNLIDTPGHHDFNFEVGRSLQACQGALLLVDASQGIQAQTLANYKICQKLNMTVIPVLTKLDLPNARPEDIKDQLELVLGFDREEILATSAKTGEGVEDILPAIVERIPHPLGAKDDYVDGTAPEDNEYNSRPLKALLFDSWYDRYQGIVCLIQIVEGTLRANEKVRFFHAGKTFEAQEVGLLAPERLSLDQLRTGQVGYLVPGFREMADAQCGETICSPNYRDDTEDGAEFEPLPGFAAAKAMVFASIYPTDGQAGSYEALLNGVSKLLLTDPSVSTQREFSKALGQGLRCGFLGLLHMDVFSQRLEQEYGIDVLVTSPTVPYKAVLESGEEILIETPDEFDQNSKVRTYLEPIVSAQLVIPANYLGPIITLLEEKRGDQEDLVFLDEDTVMLKYLLPWQEVVTDLNDKIKSISAGYASLNYIDGGFRAAKLVKIDILINKEPVDALSFICEKGSVRSRSTEVVGRLKENIDRQQFEIVIQVCFVNCGLLVFFASTLIRAVAPGGKRRENCCQI